MKRASQGGNTEEKQKEEDHEINTVDLTDTESSDEISDFDSEASRINFWKDINIKEDHNDQNRVMVKSKDHAKKDKEIHYNRSKDKTTTGKVKDIQFTAKEKKFENILNNLKV